MILIDMGNNLRKCEILLVTSFSVYVVLNIRVFVLRKFTFMNQFDHLKLENLRIFILTLIHCHFLIAGNLYLILR